MLRWTRILTMILHHSSRMEYEQAKSIAFCVLWCCILYRLYAITMHRRHEKKYENERIEKIWALFEYLNDRRASRSQNQTSQPATVSTSTTSVCASVCVCAYCKCTVHHHMENQMLNYKSCTNSINLLQQQHQQYLCSNRKFSWISEFVEWKALHVEYKFIQIDCVLVWEFIYSTMATTWRMPDR